MMTVKENPAISSVLVENVELSIPDKPKVNSELIDDDLYMKIPINDMKLLANWITELEKRYKGLGERWRLLVGQLGPYIRKKATE